MYIAPDNRRIHFKLERTFKKNDPILWYEEKSSSYFKALLGRKQLSLHTIDYWSVIKKEEAAEEEGGEGEKEKEKKKKIRGFKFPRRGRKCSIKSGCGVRFLKKVTIEEILEFNEEDIK